MLWTVDGVKVRTYTRNPVEVRDWDPRTADVVGQLRDAVRARRPGQVVDHITGVLDRTTVLLGTVEHDDEGFAVHVHVVQAGSDEVEAQRGLAKALRADPALRDEYAALKRSIIDSGTTDPVPYSMGKIRRVLETLNRLGGPTLPEPGFPSPRTDAAE